MKTVLLVEDTVDLAEEIAHILELEGFRVISANSGQQALERLHEITPDVILTDLLMPGMDGFELIERIKGDLALIAIPIIILSAKTNLSDEERRRIVGISAFIGKPCKGHQLVEAVRSFSQNSK
jgi:chemosensory pili system protein ChpA (sensor histidine kinase/response regulator)